MLASSRVREHVAISLVFTSRQRSLPFCELRERCKPERPKKDQNRARCWLPQHAQQGKKKVSNITPKCFHTRPRELQNHSPEFQRAPEEVQRAPEELQKASQEPPDLPTEPLKLPRAVQGASKGSPRDPFGRHSGTIWASKLRSRSRYWLTF